MKPVATFGALVMLGLTSLVSAADAGTIRGAGVVREAPALSMAAESAHVSRLQLADNSDQGACEVTYGSSTQCYDSWRALCRIANYLHSVSTEYHPGETCADIGYK
jgi:hypothetical protein